MLKCKIVKSSTNLILSIMSALLLTLSFPRYDFEIFAWIGLMPLLFLVKGNSKKPVFFWCWFSGTLFFFITLNWLVKTMNAYGGVPIWTGILILLLLSLYLGLYSGLFGVLTRYITEKTALPATFVAPPLWVSLEYVRGHLLTGFPWATLGYSQYKFLPLIQISDLTSVLGVSFLIVGVNAALFEITAHIKNRPAKTPASTVILIFAVAILFISSWIYGRYKLNTVYDQPERTIHVAVLQGNIPQHLKWDRDFQRRTIDIYKDLTDEANRYATDLIIWPETAAPFFFQDPSSYRQELFELVKEKDIFLLFGSPSYTVIDAADIRLFNSAYMISPRGESLSRYDKIHLVPFGEYVPLSKILFFIEKMVVGIGDFLPGNDHTVFKTPQGRFGVVICFEVIFPDLVRRFVLNGAEIMTTITNDAWFGKSSAPYQHFAMAVFRAIENRVSFARAANTGISGFISPKGEILQTSPIFVDAYLTQKISPSSTRTFYTLYGDIFAYLCISVSVLMLGISRWKGEFKILNLKSEI